MDFLAAADLEATGENTGYKIFYRPMPQAIKNHLETTMVSAAVIEAAKVEASQVAAVAKKKIAETLIANRVENNMLMVRACITAVSDGTQKHMLKRTQEAIGGMHVSMIDVAELDKLCDINPKLGEDLWSVANKIGGDLTPTEKKS